MNTKLVALALVASLSSAACAVPAASDTADIATAGEALTQVGMLGVTVPHQVAPDALQLPDAGLGYNARSSQVAPISCFDVVTKSQPNQRGQVTFSSQMDTAQASSALSIDVDAKAHYGIYKGEGSFKMAREATSSPGTPTTRLM